MIIFIVTETESEQLLDKFERGGFLRKLDLCGDITRLLKKKNWEFKRNRVSAIRGINVNIVTTTKSLVMALTFLDAYGSIFTPFFGDTINK